MANRPTPQPAGQPAHTQMIPKITEPHPAVNARATSETAVPAAQNAAPTPTSSQPATEPGGGYTAALVPLSTRIPGDLRDRYDWLRFATRTPVQQLVIQALTAYADQHPQQPGETSR